MTQIWEKVETKLTAEELKTRSYSDDTAEKLTTHRLKVAGGFLYRVAYRDTTASVVFVPTTEKE
jgi:hypothetical protein